MREKPQSFEFSLILSGVSDETDDLEDIIYQAGCDDALFYSSNGAVYLDFIRESQDIESAIVSAIKDVELAGINAKVVSVAPDHLVSMAEIAERAGLTRQAVSLFVKGQRSDGSFPHPVLKLDNKSALWRWSVVADWLFEQGKISDEKIIQCALVIEDINAALELREPQRYQKRKVLLAQLNNLS